MKKIFLFSVLLITGMGAGLTALPLQAEEPIVRSSHPRGFVADGATLPSMTAGQATGIAGSGGSASTGASADTASSLSRVVPAIQVTSGGAGVNLTGATRIDAAAQGSASVSTGQQNAAGNRVGNIGGQ